jgi:SAM-dependent methyltransferase
MAERHVGRQPSANSAIDVAEPLRDLAAQAYEISNRLCGSCRDLHALWPYIRLSRASTGVEAQGSSLQAELRGLFDRGLRKVLIAGSQDAGLLALVTRTGAGRDVDIAVLDICETPLELCRRLAKTWSLSIETIRQDLCDLNRDREFDCVLVHGTLHFIAAERRIAALTRIQRALRPSGRLILLFNTSPPVATEKKIHTDYGNLVLTELERLDVPLPDTEAVMLERLNAHQGRRDLREGAFAEPQEIEFLLDAAGLRLISCTRVDINVATPIDTLITKASKRRFMALAEPKFAV